MRTMLLTLGMLVAAAANVAAAGPATRPLTDVAPLVARLSDDNWQVRQKAQDELAAMGPDAAAPLKRALAATRDEEVRGRIEAALRQIEENRLTGPTFLTLSFRDAPLAQILAEVSRQSGVEVIAQSPGGLFDRTRWIRLSIQSHRQPFWALLKEVCDRTGLSPMTYGSGERRVVLTPRGSDGWPQGWCSAAGPALIFVESGSRHRSVQYGGGHSGRSMSLQLNAYVEPKLRINQQASSVRIDEAVDEKGNSLNPPNAYATSLFTSGSPWIWRMHLNMAYPEGMGARIATLRGALRFNITTKTENIDIGDVLAAKNATQIVGPVRITVVEVVRQEKAGAEATYRLKSTIERLAPDPGRRTDLYAIQQRLRLIDAAGRALAAQGASTNHGSNKLEFTQEYRPARPGGEPARLVGEVASDSRDVEIPFEFRDLPVP